MVDALLRAGVPVDEVASHEDGVTSLGWSVFKNNPKLASLLLSKHADINHVDKLGYTPLLWAASMDFGESTMLRTLLRAGADPESRTKDGLTALQLALKYKHAGHSQILAKQKKVSVATR